MLPQRHCRSSELVSVHHDIDLDLAQLERSDDPLQLFLESIDTVESIQDKTKLVGILTKCAQFFKDDETYKNDFRYLSVWFRYIEFSESPLDMYIYLFRKNIGSRLGFYFQKFADYLEGTNDYQKCYEVYSFAMSESGVRNAISVRDNFEAFKQRLVNYEKLAGFVVDRASVPFLHNVKMQTLRSSDEETGPPAKRMKSSESYYIVKLEGKPDERWTINLKLLYHETGEEFTPEEILCQERGIYDMVYKPKETTPFKRKTGLRVLNDSHKSTVTVPLNDVNENNMNMSNMTNSPTMYTKDADNEIMSLFNKPLDISVEKENSHPARQAERDAVPFEVKMDVDEIIYNGGQTGEAGKTGKEDHTGPEEENEQEEPYEQYQQEVQNDEHEHNGWMTPEHNSANSEQSPMRRNHLTPIAELTETSTRASEAMSSPFIEEPDHLLDENITNTDKAEGKPAYEVAVIDPFSESYKSTILNKLPRALTSYNDCFKYNRSKGKSYDIETYFKEPKSRTTIGDKRTMLEFDNELYCVRSQLQGENIYLAESSTGGLDVIKVKRPADRWEYYILKAIETRAPAMQTIVHCKGFHLYDDEGYLVLQHLTDGSLVQLVQLYKSRNESIDERLIMAIMVHLLQTIHCLHHHGIIHGALSPENVMIDLSTKNNLAKLANFDRSTDIFQAPPDLKSHFEIDYHGLANILHTLLFHKSLQVEQTEIGGCKLKNNLKSYWDDIWAALFDALLNGQKAPQDLHTVTEKINTKVQRARDAIDELIEDFIRKNKKAA